MRDRACVREDGDVLGERWHEVNGNGGVSGNGEVNGKWDVAGKGVSAAAVVGYNHF